MRQPIKKIKINNKYRFLMRLRREIEFKQLSERMGIPRRTLYHWVSTGIPDEAPSMFDAIALAIGTTRRSLLRDTK